MGYDDKRFMDRCYALAEEARSNGESPVGTVILRQGEVVAEGVERWGAPPEVVRLPAR